MSKSGGVFQIDDVTRTMSKGGGVRLVFHPSKFRPPPTWLAGYGPDIGHRHGFHVFLAALKKIEVRVEKKGGKSPLYWSYRKGFLRYICKTIPPPIGLIEPDFLKKFPDL